MSRARPKPISSFTAAAVGLLLAVSCADDDGSKTCSDENFDSVMEEYETCTLDGDCPFDDECLQGCFTEMCDDLEDLGCETESVGCDTL